MTTTYLLNTNMVSYIVKGQSKSARSRLLALAPDEVAVISSVTAAEIRYGLSRRPDATALRAQIDAFLASIQALPWRNDEAEVYGRVWAQLEAGGINLGNMDLMIAAHALAIGAVVTNDKAFRRVAGIHVKNWATDLR